MATEKTSKKKKKKSPEGSNAGSSVEKSASSAQAQGSGEPQMRSALLPLIWLLIPFIAVVGYGLLTRE